MLTTKEVVHNIKERLKIHLIGYAYIYAPAIGLIFYALLLRMESCNFNEIFQSSLISVSGSLAGFLFTSLGIMIALPENKFTNLLKKTKHMTVIYRSMIIGITTLLLSMILILFSICNEIALIAFIIGISETFVSAYYLYKVSYYSGKSK